MVMVKKIKGKKKQIMSNTQFIITIIIAITLITGILIIFNQKEKFNPKEDICLKYFDEADKNEFGCIDWRSKNSCEKGNESWIEETIINIYDNNNNLLFKNAGDNYLNSPYFKNSFNEGFIKIKNQTICREKTQQELAQDYCNKNSKIIIVANV